MSPTANPAQPSGSERDTDQLPPAPHTPLKQPRAQHSFALYAQQTPEAGRPGYGLQLGPLLAVWPWASHWAFLSLGFLIWKSEG